MITIPKIRRIAVMLCVWAVANPVHAQNPDSSEWRPSPEGLRRMGDYFPFETVARGDQTREFEWGETIGQDGSGLDLDAFNLDNGSTGMIVLHKGRIVYEGYWQGADAESRLNSWSMVKSITGTLIGIAEGEGLIESILDPVVRYVPQLAGTAYRDVTIEQVLQMSSGVELEGAGEEDVRITCLALPPGPVFADCDAVRAEFADLRELLLSLDQQASEPGTAFRYSDADSLVLGWVLQNATGRSPAEYLSEKLWQPLGMEDDAIWLLDRPGGMTLTGMSLSARLRDYARFGLLMLNDGMLDGERILPEGWVERATVPSRPYLEIIENQGVGYQYQWWVLPDGFIVPTGESTFAAHGAMGQFLRIDPQHDLVIVKTSAWTDLSGWDLEKVLAFDAVTAAIIEALGYDTD